MAVKVVLVEDHKIVRDGISYMLSKEGSIEVVAEVDNGMDALTVCRQLKPDIVLMDISLPGLDGIEASRLISRDFPETKIIALSMHSNKRYVTKMLEAGAMGYLQKDCDLSDLLKAIRSVERNQTYLDSKVIESLTGEYVRRSRMSRLKKRQVLTNREREVVSLLAEGKKTKEIAKILNISPKTVETHRRKIMEKLKVSSIAELTKYALREEIISLNDF